MLKHFLFWLVGWERFLVAGRRFQLSMEISLLTNLLSPRRRYRGVKTAPTRADGLEAGIARTPQVQTFARRCLILPRDRLVELVVLTALNSG